MRLVLVLCFFLMSSFSWGQSVGAQDAQMMLERMKASGQISAQQAVLAQKYMKDMDQKQWDELNKKAKDCIQRNPAAVEKLKSEGMGALSPDLCN